MGIWERAGTKDREQRGTQAAGSLVVPLLVLPECLKTPSGSVSATAPLFGKKTTTPSMRSIDIAPPKRSVAERSWGAVYWWCTVMPIDDACDFMFVSPPLLSAVNVCS